MTRRRVALAAVSCALAASPSFAQTASAPAQPAAPAMSRAPTAPARTAADECLTQARSRAADAFQKHRSQEQARLQLEIDAARCVDATLSPASAHLVGTVNADLARLARDFVVGTRSLAAYRAGREDRQKKLAALLADSTQRDALLRGDEDGDLVPDSVDKCPKTPAGAPTDARGCPVRIPPSATSEREERELRATLAGARTLFNASCKDAPPLAIPSPLEWGRGQQTKTGQTGFNLAVAKVGGQPPGCEIFYEIQLRFIDPNPGNPALPPAKIVTMVFSASEDLLSDPSRAIFGLPVGAMVLSPARNVAREAFLREYFRASWRVRAVNGANQVSPWSPFITQGPASAGVPA